MKTNKLTRKNMMSSTAGIEVESTIIQGEFDLNDCLMQVTTAPAAAQEYGVAYSTVTSAISRRRLDAIKLNGVWIIRKVDAAKLWSGKVRGIALLAIPTIATALLAIAAY